MRLDSTNPWVTQPSHSALVSLSTHSLHASISGPIRLPNAPLLIFFTGGGACCAIYIKLQQLLSQHYRVLFYDRAGNDQSTLPPPRSNGDDKIYAQDIARELVQLLSITQLKPPYIPIGHSYGGIPARCFFALNPSAVAGMVLLDTATELTLALFPRIPPPELESLIENLDWNAATHFREDSNMTDEEYEYATGAQERCIEATKRQDTHTSAHRLAHEHQIDNQALGSRPLSVLRFHARHDYQVLYDAAVKNGDGTEEERASVRAYLEKYGLYHEQIIRAQCGLSSDVEYKYIGEWGHDLPCRKPEVLVDEIRKLVERVKRKNENVDGRRI
jgi:pimeloyl-ACP methyl ester carboxylesterase